MQKLKEMLKKAGYIVILDNDLGHNQFQIMGYKDKIDFTITVEKGNYLDASVSDGQSWRKKLNGLQDIGTRYMRTEPICRFSGKMRAGNLPFDKMTRHYLHWNIKDPEELLRHFANGTGGFAGADVHDIHIFSGKRLEDFVDEGLHARNQKQAELHKKYNGIFGMDPGCCDVARIEATSNLGLFLEVSILTDQHVTAIQKNMQASAIRAVVPWLKTAYAEMAIQQDSYRDSLAVDYVTRVICDRNGFKYSTPNRMGRLNVIDQAKLNKWCEFYGTYLDKNFDDEQLRLVLELYFKDEDISMYEPKGGWH